jgi:hypothetical protein
MSNHEDLGQPEETGDSGRTTSPKEEGMARQEDEAGGTGVPGVDVGQADALQPDEEDVRRPEHRDGSR